MMPAQRDMFTKRYRVVKPPTPSENQIQMALVERFHYLGRKDAICFHCPNGGWRFKRSAGMLKAMGVLPGVSDLIFLWPVRQALFLELKANGREPTDLQRTFLQRMAAFGFHTAWTDNLDDAVKVLQHYGLMERPTMG